MAKKPFTEQMAYLLKTNREDGHIYTLPHHNSVLYNIFIKEGVNSTTKGVAVDSVIKKNIKDLDPEFWDLYKNLTTSY